VVVAHGDFIEGVDAATGEPWIIEVVHTPGHTSNHICFGLGDDGTGTSVLFTGDHVMGWSTSVISPPDGDLFDYMNSLQVLLDRDDQVYWPTHGTCITDPKVFVNQFIAHRRGREAQIVAALRERESTIKDLVPAMYAEVDKRLWRAAANSVYSHTLALYREGRLMVAEGEPSLTATWRVTPEASPAS
jgi:glyoxylase-like metal-dependent hydrolase (beta-lactamase superfamily II)